MKNEIEIFDVAPIVLFVYKRFDETKATLDALKLNYLAAQSDLIVFSDGARSSKDQEEVERVRTLFRDLQGFRTVRLCFKEKNSGLANSVIAGVGEVLDQYGCAIVLEDDLITSVNFLNYMNQALVFYRDNSKIFAVSGFSYPLKSMKNSMFDVGFSYRSYSWGWATWKDRWLMVDWNVDNYDEFRVSPKKRKLFDLGGSDLSKMLDRQQSGKIDSWMIRWVYTQHRLGLLDVFPKVSKVQNIGFGANATHTNCSDRRYRTRLDDGLNCEFRFNPIGAIDPLVQKEWEWFHSYLRRAWYRFLNLFPLSGGDA